MMAEPVKRCIHWKDFTLPRNPSATAFTGISPKSVSEHVRRPVRPSAGVRDGPVRDRAIPSHSVANAAASHRRPRRYLPIFTATTAPTISPVRTSRIQLSFTQSTRGDASSANPASDDANPSNPMRSLPISVPGTIRRRSSAVSGFGCAGCVYMAPRPSRSEANHMISRARCAELYGNPRGRIRFGLSVRPVFYRYGGSRFPLFFHVFLL